MPNVLGEEIPNHILNFLDDRLRSAIWFACRDGEGAIHTFPGAKRGNRIYAYRQNDRINDALKDLRMDEGDCLFITATLDRAGKLTPAQSWEKGPAQLPRFTRKLRKLGLRSYLHCKEAHQSGHFHSHGVYKLDHKLPCFVDDKGKYRLADESLKAAIEDVWEIGFLDIQVIRDEGAGLYLAKELGKAGHIEDAIARAKKGAAAANDVKKLWAQYWLAKKKIRQVSCSRDLIKHMINPTDEEEQPEGEYMILPPRVRFADWFEPKTAVLDPTSEEFRELTYLFDQKKALTESILYALKGCKIVSMAELGLGA
jgi:hypothetical protein